MATKKFLAGPGKALLFRGDELIGVADALTNNTFGFTIENEEIRGGFGNVLFGKYFHDSNLNVTLTNAMFDLRYVAASLGTDVEQGGLSIKEQEIQIVAEGGYQVADTPVAMLGGDVVLGWYKKPAETEWSIGNFDNTGRLAIPGAAVNDVYCIKYFYTNENAQSITVKAQYVPAVLHVVIINDLFAGDVADIGSAAKYGRLITDVPRLQMNGNQELSLTASGAATVELTGSALAVTAAGSAGQCEETQIYGTMTEEIFNAKWQDNVKALAIANSELEMAENDTATLNVYAVFGAAMASKRYDNANFTFTLQAGAPDGLSVSTAGVVSVGAGATAGTGYIEVTLPGYPGVAPAYAEVTVTA